MQTLKITCIIQMFKFRDFARFYHLSLMVNKQLLIKQMWALKQPTLYLIIIIQRKGHPLHDLLNQNKRMEHKMRFTIEFS